MLVKNNIIIGQILTKNNNNGSVTAPFFKTKQMTLEDKFKINNVESTLKCLLQYADLKSHHKDWVLESYKNILDFKHQNDII